MVVLIEPRKTGAMWIRAMFKYYCRKNECTTMQMSPSTFVAEGENAKQAHFEFERAMGELLIKIINGRASGVSDIQTIRAHVKELYGV